MMDSEALARLMREAPAVNSVNVSFDAAALYFKENRPDQMLGM
jgi:hypothetical protein